MTLRGCDPDDPARFGGDARAKLVEAAAELSWLLERNYPMTPTLALVGDRHGLDARARLALQRGVVGATVSSSRRSRCVEVTSLAGTTLEIDAFNLVVTLEVALCGGPVFVGLDGAMRDLAGLRGSYRTLPETDRALTLLAGTLRAAGVARCRWWVDAPVSNAGTLATKLRAWHEAGSIAGEVVLVRDADPVLAGRSLVVSSDARVIDEARSWVPLANLALGAATPAPWTIALDAQPR